jgi:hypothetical protein
MTRLVSPPPCLAAIVAQVESRWAVTLYCKESRNANP